MSVKYDDYFTKASRAVGVDKHLLIALATAESGIDQSAVSEAGAVGVMQLMPATAREMGVKDINDAEQNIMGGAKYLKKLLDQFEGDPTLALSAYNAGPKNVKEHGGVLPSTEDYVNKILNNYGDKLLLQGALTFNPDVENAGTNPILQGALDMGEGDDLVWWGDILRVVIIILLIILVVVFVCICAGSNVSKKAGKLIKDVAGSLVEGGETVAE